MFISQRRPTEPMHRPAKSVSRARAELAAGRDARGAQSARPPVSGIPRMADYREITQSPAFREMEEFSDAFLQTHADALAEYSRKWVRDPLHQWSRQWEYPYVFEHAAAFLTAERGPARALDAGSGVTFFPYYLQSRLAVSDVACVDSDESLKGIFESIQRASDARVHFTAADLASLPFEDRSFQIVYCISVLEHTENYPAIIREFRRVLDDGGLLVITFDVSIDGDCDITVEGAVRLLEELENAFPASGHAATTLPEAIHMPDVLTTRGVARHDRRLVPWRHPLRSALSNMLRGRLPKRWNYPQLTCFCGVFQNEVVR